ncbi:TonB-dependent receptor [Sphingorhabdus sp. M41]|uniref:TonB-dependent receptor n=1 Tax=Sphingorhabdus sp. M41 TaxID=1806885 RepID=UPI00078D78FD|nr:TonB-dependent receptor [Sphingorhabdus sp. M41]AMO70524.1 TonB-dependent receptor [Sphingorhabdus sp. M41]
MKRITRDFFACGVAGIALGLPSMGHAQSASDDEVAAEQGVDRNAIIVTANRREEAITDVGVAIQAFSGEQLDKLQVNSTEDLQAVVPSLNVSRGYQGIPIYTLRGIGFNTINLSATSTVGTYQDEVALAYPFMNSGPVFDLERVEVLKGPQGTLYGRNTTGGLVNFISAKPEFGDFNGSIAVDLGSEETLNTKGHLNIPIGESVALRAAWRTERSWEGWQKSISRDEKQGQVERYGGRLTIAADPIPDMHIELAANFWVNKSDTLAAQAVGFTPNTDPANGTLFSLFNAAGLPAYVAANGNNWSSDTADWQPLDQRAQNIGRGTGIDRPNAEDSNFYGLRAMLQFDFTPDVSFISLTGFNHVKRDASYDWSGAPYEILSQHAEGEIDSLSQEIRFQGTTGPAEWVVGGYYANDKVVDTNQTLLGENANVGAIRALILAPQAALGGASIFDAFNTFGYTPADVLTSFRTYRDEAEFDVETFSAFASADWELSPSLTLTTGIRYTQDTQDYEGCSRDLNGSMLPNVNLFNRFFFFTSYGAITAPISENQCNTFDVDTLTFGPVTSRLKEDNVAWRGALTWQPNDDTLLYASVSRGYKAGSTPVNAANIATQNRPARQEQLTAYEVGTKLALANLSFNLNLAGFYYDYSDKQLAVYFADPIYTTLLRLDNIPESRAYGIDGDFTWFATDELTLSVAATWLQTEIIGYQGINAAGQPLDYDGFAFPYSPEFSGAATITYDTPITSDLGLRAMVNGRYQSSTSSTIEDFDPLAIDSYGILNTSLALYDLDGVWEASIWGRNVTDTYYWSSAATNANSAVRFPGRSASYGATVRMRF